MLDVLGSIGGLYALLQSIHVLLFGRAMLWGLTGTKLIAPFGLLGMCRSQGFRRRLRDQYHRQPTHDNPETFLMGAFLRDFVVELGPADFNPATDHVEPVSPSNMAASTLSINQRERAVDDKILPMKLELRPSFDAAIDIEKIASHVRSRVDSEGST
ncbi:hypothetical protein B0J17DRAFT_454354 [Rhizoctonia solani]|nr:hypothetical protein B0J17DRAFT_454354 [Rhizoctonia solani]